VPSHLDAEWDHRLKFFLFLFFSSWRRMRKAAQDGLRTRAGQSFRPTQHKEAILPTVNILAEPTAWFSHFQRSVASTIMTTIYGKAPPESKSDENISKFHDFIHGLTRAAMPGANLVEIFPWMRFIPSR
jgi:hypothetical protein